MHKNDNLIHTLYTIHIHVHDIYIVSYQVLCIQVCELWYMNMTYNHDNMNEKIPEELTRHAFKAVHTT